VFLAKSNNIIAMAYFKGGMGKSGHLQTEEAGFIAIA
jgi:hypothetical protein